MYFQQPSVGKTVALALLMSNLRRAAELYASDHAAAVTLMEKVVKRLSSDAQGFADPTFDRDVKLASDVLELMKQDAPQGDLYGR